MLTSSTSPSEKGDRERRLAELAPKCTSWKAVAAAMGEANHQPLRAKAQRMGLKLGSQVCHVNAGGQPAPGPDRLEADEPEAPTPAAELPFEVQSAIAHHEYFTTPTHFVFTVNKQLVSIARDDWKNIVERYSAAGTNQTRNEIARAVGMNTKVLEACLRAYGHYKARPPILREELADAEAAGDTEPIMERAIEVAEHAFDVKLERRKLERERADYLALRAQLSARQEWARELAKQFVTPIPPHQVPSATKRKARRIVKGVLKTIADMHMGKLVLPGAVSGFGSGGMNKAVMFRLADETAAQFVAKYSDCDIMDAGLALLGDLLESLLGNMHWGHAGEMWCMGHVQLRYAIDWLERIIVAMLSVLPKHVPLRITSVGGNHDRLGEDRKEDPTREGHLLAMEFLKERLSKLVDAGRVVFVYPTLEEGNEAADRRKWAGITVGGHRFLTTHGDSSLTPAKLVLKDQEETRVMHDTYTVLTAHLHHIYSQQDGRYLHHRLPSVVGPDTFSDGLGAFGYRATTDFEVKDGHLWPSPEWCWLDGRAAA